MAVNPAPVVVPVEKTWVPTRKWFAAFAAFVGAYLVSGLVTEGFWDAEEKAIVATSIPTLIGAYFTPNEDTPGGVPVKPKEA